MTDLLGRVFGGGYQLYKSQTSRDQRLQQYLAQQVAKKHTAPSFPSMLEMLKGLEWTGKKTIQSGIAFYEVPMCSHCQGLCTDSKKCDGLKNARFLDALPKSWKGHKEGCKFIAEIVPRIAELMLLGEEG